MVRKKKGMLVVKRDVEDRVVLDFTRATDEEIADLRGGRKVIEVLVTKFAGGPTVHLGFTAPKGVKVDRHEVYDARKRDEAQAAAAEEGGARVDAA